MATNNADFKVKKGLIVTEGITLGGHTFNDIDIGTEFVDTDDHIMSSGAIREKIESYSYGTGDATLAGTQTFSGAKTFSSAIELNDDLHINDSHGRIEFKRNASNTATNAAITFNDNADALKARILYQYSTNQMQFYVNSENQLLLNDGVLSPATDNNVDLGTSSLKFKDSFFGLVDAENFKINGGQGSDGQVLTSTGSGVAWEDAASGDATLAGTQTFTGAKTFSGGINSASYGPHSTGYVILGASNDTLAITSNGAHNTHISTNSNTNSGSILIQQGANNPITITPNGTGNVNLNTDTVRVGDNNADATITTRGTGDLTLSTNEGTNAGTILLADGVNGNISITPNGTGQVTISAQMTSKANVVAVSSNTTLTLAQTGSYVFWTNGSLTLPASGTVGTQYTIFNNTGGSATVQLNASNCSIVSGWPSVTATGDHEAVTFVCVSANNWVQIG
jgi:hypothetical protein